MNPRNLIRLLLEASGAADQNVAKLLARNSDDLVDAMRDGKVRQFLGATSEGRAALNNPEFMRMTTRVSDNLDYITRAGSDLAAGRAVNPAEFLNKMEIPANSNIGTSLTKGLTDFNTLAARGASTTASNADAIAAARNARAARAPRDVSADEVAERLNRAKAGPAPAASGADDAARTAENTANTAENAAPKSGPKPGMNAADDAVRATLPKLSWNDSRLLNGLESAKSGYGSKIELLLARNVSPEEHAKWMKQIEVNARRGGLSDNSLGDIRRLGQAGKISPEQVARFENISALQTSGWTGYMPRKWDSLSASFENATMHPFKSGLNLYKESLFAPITIPARVGMAAYRNGKTTAAVTGLGLGALTIADMQTDGASTTAIKNGADFMIGEGYSHWANWASWNAALGVTIAGKGYELIDEEAAKKWTADTAAATTDVVLHMPGTAARLAGLSESTISNIAAIPVLGAPLKSIRTTNLYAHASGLVGDEAANNPLVDTEVSPPPATAALDEQPAPSSAAGAALDTARNAGQRIADGAGDLAENFAGQFAMADILRNPGQAWAKMKEAAKNNPTLQTIIEVGDRHPFLKWGMVGGFAWGMLSDGSGTEKVMRGIRNALFLGALLDFVGSLLFNRPSGIATLFNKLRSDMPAGPDTANAPAPEAAPAAGPQAGQQPAATQQQELKGAFKTQAAPVADPSPAPDSTAYAFKNAAGRTETRPVRLAPDLPAANDPSYRQEIPAHPAMMSMGG